jgi:NAD(P)-dependent dehydrogenase (short-subunit alcohol dehydrogenase family)
LIEYGSQFDVVQADVSKNADLDRLYGHIKTKYGHLDVLFANAGIASFSPLAQASEEHYDQVFNTNVRGLFFTVQKALPILAKGSSVVLTASVVAIKGFPGSSVYSATKAAVRNFARTWTAEIPVSDVRFNVLSPGPIATPIWNKMDLSKEEQEGFAANILASNPSKRFGTAEEMAKVALFLASDDSSYIAGADIGADGGFGQI